MEALLLKLLEEARSNPLLAVALGVGMGIYFGRKADDVIPDRDPKHQVSHPIIINGIEVDPALYALVSQQIKHDQLRELVAKLSAEVEALKSTTNKEVSNA